MSVDIAPFDVRQGRVMDHPHMDRRGLCLGAEAHVQLQVYRVSARKLSLCWPRAIRVERETKLSKSAM